MSQRTPQSSPQGGPPPGGKLAPILTILVVVAVLVLYFFNTTALSWLVPDLVVTPVADAPGAATATVEQAATAVAEGAAAAVEAEATVGVSGPPAGTPMQEAPASENPAEVPAQINGLPTILFAALPVEAHETIALIDAGGPFPFEQDDSVFQNREGLLPSRPSGYYREFTVITPGEDDRGARRIVSGAEGELYYTDDHYDSFSYVVR